MAPHARVEQPRRAAIQVSSFNHAPELAYVSNASTCILVFQTDKFSVRLHTQDFTPRKSRSQSPSGSGMRRPPTVPRGGRDFDLGGGFHYSGSYPMVFQHSGARDFDLGGGFHYSGSYPMVFQHSVVRHVGKRAAHGRCAVEAAATGTPTHPTHLSL